MIACCSVPCHTLQGFARLMLGQLHHDAIDSGIPGESATQRVEDRSVIYAGISWRTARHAARCARHCQTSESIPGTVQRISSPFAAASVAAG